MSSTVRCQLELTGLGLGFALGLALGFALGLALALGFRTQLALTL